MISHEMKNRLNNHLPILWLYVPGWHFVQVSMLFAPDSVLNVPTGHGSHAVSLLWPGLSLYVPGGQGVNPPSFPSNESQKPPIEHCSHFSFPKRGWNSPAGQSWHSLAPDVGWWVPGLHLKHSPTAAILSDEYFTAEHDQGSFYVDTLFSSLYIVLSK